MGSPPGGAGGWCLTPQGAKWLECGSGGQGDGIKEWNSSAPPPSTSPWRQLRTVIWEVKECKFPPNHEIREEVCRAWAVGGIFGVWAHERGGPVSTSKRQTRPIGPDLLSTPSPSPARPSQNEVGAACCKSDSVNIKVTAQVFHPILCHGGIDSVASRAATVLMVCPGDPLGRGRHLWAPILDTIQSCWMAILLDVVALEHSCSCGWLSATGGVVRQAGLHTCEVGGANAAPALSRRSGTTRRTRRTRSPWKRRMCTGSPTMARCGPIRVQTAPLAPPPWACGLTRGCGG